MDPTLYILPLLFSAAILLILAAHAWTLRATPAALPFSLAMLLAAGWALNLAFDLSSPNLADKLFWMRGRFVFTATLPVTIFATIIQHIGRADLLNRRRIAALLVVPTLTIILAWTSEYHTLFRYNLRLNTASPIVTLVWDNGTWYWVHVGYTYALYVACLALLIRSLPHAPPLYRHQTLLIITGGLLPLIADLLYNLNITFAPGYNPAPAVFVLTGLLFARALFRYRMWDLVPIARSTVMEHMSDLMLVFDARDRLVDLNPAAQKALGLNARQALGQPVDIVLHPWLDMFDHYRGVQSAHDEISVGEGEQRRVFALTITPLQDAQARFAGRIVLLHDITKRRQVEEALLRANQQLQTRLLEIENLHTELHEQAIRDHLTGLFNRRYLEETLERVFSRAARDHHPVSLVILDLDHLKMINDSVGHKAGDAVLQALSNLLRAQTRPMDIACRFGGDEFVVIMPGAPLENALQRVEQWRHSFAALRVEYDGKALESTLSLGVAAFPIHGATGEDILIAADKALYAAKNKGRNRVIIAK